MRQRGLHESRKLSKMTGRMQRSKNVAWLVLCIGLTHCLVQASHQRILFPHLQSRRQQKQNYWNFKPRQVIWILASSPLLFLQLLLSDLDIKYCVQHSWVLTNSPKAYLVIHWATLFSHSKWNPWSKMFLLFFVGAICVQALPWAISQPLSQILLVWVIKWLSKMFLFIALKCWLQEDKLTIICWACGKTDMSAFVKLFRVHVVVYLEPLLESLFLQGNGISGVGRAGQGQGSH